MSRVLILAGTAEARRLAAGLCPDHAVTASLAGATAAPAAYPCPTRTGGFGGADGLAAYLAAHRIGAMIDATHPFASRISANAVTAAEKTATPLIRVCRPAWAPRPGERWIDAPDMAAAAAALPAGARPFLAVGRAGAAAFTHRTDLHILLRVIERPGAPFPGRGAFVVARPPFDEAAERALFLRLGVTHLVVKNAGGEPGRTKLDAAAALGLPIVVVRRPPEPGSRGICEAEVARWLASRPSR